LVNHDDAHDVIQGKTGNLEAIKARLEPSKQNVISEA
jgi:hypothetical protein